VQRSDVLLRPWTGPFGGVPPFDQVEVSALEPAVHAAVGLARQELRAITAQTAPPDLDNTIEAYERAGRALQRVLAVYRVWTTTLATPEVQEVERRVEPVLAAWADEVVANADLFARIDAVAQQTERAAWSPESRRLVQQIHRHFVRHGARLSPTSKARLAEINQRLASCFTAFNQNLLADEETCVLLERPEDLRGLPAGLVAVLAEAATERGLSGAWAVVNTRSVVEPFLVCSTRRDLRERVWRAFVGRGARGGPTDNHALIAEILALRFERARLLGHPTHAHWRLEDSMAGTPERALALMEAVWGPAVMRVRQDVAEQRAEAGGEPVAPWDFRHLQERVRKRLHDLDEEVIKPYLQLDRLREGMFWMARRLYGLVFEPAPEVPVYHPDVQVWSVQTVGGRPVGLWYFDPYARPGKHSGAWMSAYREQEAGLEEVLTLVSNNCNFSRGAEGAPCLLSWNDARTLFHEFGHGLHGLLSQVRYGYLSGTQVARDYVEFPSQIHERWLQSPELLERFARHARTDEPMPGELLGRLLRATTFGQGFGTTEYLASALVDMRLHLADPPPADPAAFEVRALAEIGMPSEVVMRHRTPQFAHLFASDAYSAGYYSYLWADVLTADAFEAFVEAGSMFDQGTAQRLVTHVLSVGDTCDPAEGFRAFRGRDVEIGALMRDRGFVGAARGAREVSSD
jgi:peptidyl-dipeptidase Dcp